MYKMRGVFSVLSSQFPSLLTLKKIHVHCTTIKKKQKPLQQQLKNTFSLSFPHYPCCSSYSFAWIDSTQLNSDILFFHFFFSNNIRETKDEIDFSLVGVFRFIFLLVVLFRCCILLSSALFTFGEHSKWGNEGTKKIMKNIICVGLGCVWLCCKFFKKKNQEALLCTYDAYY